VNARIAVIIPCYNDGELVSEAVRSVVEPEPVEVVLVDDASTDEDTRKVVRRLEQNGTRIVRHELNAGVAAARMTGLGATSARYVFPLDADDLTVEGALSLMADRLDAFPEAAVCYGDYAEFGDSKLVRAVPERLDPFRLAYTNEYPISALFRRSWLESVGGWQGGEYRGSSYEDWNLWMTLAEQGAVALHVGPGVLTYRRRLHGERKLDAGRRRHRALYRELRTNHPRLFADLPEYRRSSDMSPLRKAVYPVVYGGRRRFAVERKVKARLDRLGIWTLRR
jgi:glycosyltransferase involved in cell wall biosynthesis